MIPSLREGCFEGGKWKEVLSKIKLCAGTLSSITAKAVTVPDEASASNCQLFDMNIWRKIDKKNFKGS